MFYWTCPHCGKRLETNIPDDEIPRCVCATITCPICRATGIIDDDYSVADFGKWLAESYAEYGRREAIHSKITVKEGNPND